MASATATIALQPMGHSNPTTGIINTLNPMQPTSDSAEDSPVSSPVSAPESFSAPDHGVTVQSSSSPTTAIQSPSSTTDRAASGASDTSNPSAHQSLPPVGPSGQPQPDLDQIQPNPPSTNDSLEQWKSKWLRTWALLVLIALAIIMIATVITLLIISVKNNGFAEVSQGSQNEKTFAGVRLGLSLAYSFLVVFLLQAFGMLLSNVVDACARRQPYIELVPNSDGSGPTARDSFLLDYSNPLWNFVNAGRNRHLILLVAFILTPGFKLLVIPLTAHLFDESAVQSTRRTNFALQSRFNSSGFGFESDTAQILDLALAVQVYGVSPPPWTSLQYGFRNFSAPSHIEGVVPLANVSVNIDAYSATIKCHRIRFMETYNITDLTARIPITLNDNGCIYSYPLYPVRAKAFLEHQTYVETFQTTSCSPDQGLSRLGLFSAFSITAPNGVAIQFTNISLISCSTAYYMTRGIIEATYENGLGASSIPSYRGFTSNDTLLLNPRPASWKNFETQIHQTGLISNVDILSSNQFGSVVYQRAKKINPAQYLDPTVLIQALSEVFQSVYALTAHQYMFQAISSPSDTASGDLQVSTNRIIVQLPIAIVVIAILASIAVLLIWILYYTTKTKSILYEEPKGILGNASLLFDNKFAEHIKDVRQVANGKIWRAAGERGQLVDEGWKFTKWDDPPNGKIESCNIRPQKRFWRIL